MSRKFFPKDKVILITGASSGIGRALALACARRGAKVALAARSAGRLRELERFIGKEGGSALAIPADITRNDDVVRMVDETVKQWGRLDGLINNAGYGVFGKVEQLPPTVMRRNFETNLFAAIACAQAVLPHLRRQGGGIIVNVESIVALRSMPLCACYAATKHALHAFSEAMRVELAAERISVLSVCPGVIDTDFFAHRVNAGNEMFGVPPWVRLSSERCAARIVRAMERGRSQVVITAHARLIALLQRLSPRVLDWGLIRGMSRLFPPSSVRVDPTFMI
ncbi:MAG: SDR family NAD(P)-dependent oxidoreductase [Verrucomicrobiae bacterium]|nr:SDR family NAD(P)-dependent oxidoreductase [Verrucomicrobiae bacterium]